MMKKLLKILLTSFIILFVLIAGLVIYATFSVDPSVWFTRFAFSLTSYTPHELLDEYKETVSVSEDITYTSNYNRNTFNIIMLNDLDEKRPTIIWIHGGAFVAGDKKDVEDYMIVLANEGYVIITMNYALGPKSYYPTPLIQVGEIYTYLKENDTQYPMIDFDQIIIGGDSAGAHIAAQFTIIQTNADYASTLEIPATIPDGTIQGVILFCGPYNFSMLKHMFEGISSPVLKTVMPFIAKRIGAAYLGSMNWENEDKWNILTLKDYITADFPPTLITDGNTLSFEEHGMELSETLAGLNIEVTSIFYEADLLHEYQFNLSTIHEDGRNYAMETLAIVLDFLEEHTNDAGGTA